jgi:sugar phosphate isomerase/epimerase
LPGESAYLHWMRDGYDDFQKSTHIRLCIENLPAMRIWGRPFNMVAWNTPTGMARFQSLTMDTTHLGTWGLDPERFYEAAADRVGHVHLSNFDGREHRRPEAGHLRLDRLLARLAASAYPGSVTLELHPDALEAGAPDTRVQTLMQVSLEYCRASARNLVPP